MEEKDKVTAEPKASRRSLGPWIAAVLIALLSNAGWAAFFVAQTGTANQAAQAPESTKEEVVSSTSREPGPLMGLTTFVVNLNDPVSTRYLRIGISLELISESDRAIVEKHLVPLRDQYIRHLSSLETSQLLSAADKDDLKKVLMEKTSSVLPKPVVREIYFTEFMMQ